MTVGQRIKAARKHAGMTQQQLETAAGLPKKILYQWETGQRTPNALHVNAIARTLDILVPELMGFSVKECFEYANLAREEQNKMVEACIKASAADFVFRSLPENEAALLVFYRSLSNETKEMIDLFIETYNNK